MDGSMVNGGVSWWFPVAMAGAGWDVRMQLHHDGLRLRGRQRGSSASASALAALLATSSQRSKETWPGPQLQGLLVVPSKVGPVLKTVQGTCVRQANHMKQVIDHLDPQPFGAVSLW